MSWPHHQYESSRGERELTRDKFLFKGSSLARGDHQYDVHELNRLVEPTPKKQNDEQYHPGFFAADFPI
jgi:hypothetical protein